jgi:hypothetical protein
MDRLVSWDQKPHTENSFLTEVIHNMAQKERQNTDYKTKLKDIIGTSHDNKLDSLFKEDYLKNDN